MDTIRQQKVGRLIQKELSTLFQNEAGEYVAGSMVSITTVRVSQDLSYAKIYVSVFPSGTADKIIRSLEENNRNIRFMIGKKIGKQVRIIPELKFYIDDSLDYIEKLDNLLK